MQPNFFSQIENDTLYELLQLTSLKNALLFVVSSTLHIENCNDEANEAIGLRPLERIDQILSENSTNLLKNCIQFKKKYTAFEELDGKNYYLEMIPNRDGAIIAFIEEYKATYDGNLRVIHQKSAQYIVGIMSAISKIDDSEIKAELHKQCLRMTRLLDHSDFLHESWLIENIPLENKDICELCYEIAETTEQHSGYKVTVECSEDCVLLVSKDLLMQAIYNLITNAIKASPDNKEIKIIIHNDPLSPSITVSDNGVGLDPSLFEKLLNNWNKQVSVEQIQKLSPHSVSLGLGLPFVQRVAMLHGGQLLLSANKDGGSNLHLVLSHIPSVMQNLNLESEMRVVRGDSLTDIELSVL